MNHFIKFNDVRENVMKSFYLPESKIKKEIYFCKAS